jgi:hypothetical protein
MKQLHAVSKYPMLYCTAVLPCGRKPKKYMGNSFETLDLIIKEILS